MLIRQNQYPEFGTDQLLTSDHLNKLLGYVDEQGRLTRANLIGIGILCGLEVSVNDAGTELTISKGCGITSLGYIVSTEARTYTEFKTYDVTQDQKYDLFVNGSNRPRFRIDELKEEATVAGTTKLTAAYLQNRVVVMYVELLTENNKNCDPSSCDDKGINVTVNLRPLVIHRDDVARYLGARIVTQNVLGGAVPDQLPILQMRRFNVPSTPLPDSPSLLGAYQAILSQAFFSSLESTLTQAFGVVAPLVADLYSGNPFAGVATRYKFLYDGSITATDLVYIQYYYDLFSDVYTAYNNFREAAIKIIGVCLPDEKLFPQHLLLGPAGNFTQAVTANNILTNGLVNGLVKRVAPDVVDTANISFRNDFMRSAALRSCCGEITELRSLFKRLVTMLGKFSVQRRNFTLLQTYGGANTAVAAATRNTDAVSLVPGNINLVRTASTPGFSFVTIAKPSGTPASLNISTGVSASGVVLGAGAAEVNWSCPAGMGTVITPHGAWDSVGGCGWLGNAGGGNAGDFNFTRTFTIPSSGTINIQALADNYLTIKIDNVQVAATPGLTGYGFKSLNTVRYTGVVAAGTHTITAVLHNNEGPLGFSLNGTVAYTVPVPVVPPPPPVPTIPPVPPVNIPVRITPSFLGNLPLSLKSIPYYYDVTSGNDPLYRQWDYEKTIKGKADRNLSYNSVQYNSGTPDFINQVLRYNLERYNFFRIEGHIGDTYQNALSKIETIRDQYRLPFQVIALRSTVAAAIANQKEDCCSDGIALSYNILKAEWSEAANNFITYLGNTPEAAALFSASAYIMLLNDALALLKPDVPSFVAVYPSFISKLTDIDTIGRSNRAAVLAKISNREQTTSFKLGEDLIDRMDEVILSYKKNAFTEIYNAYKLSQASVERALSLPEYIKENPGLQHKAGVPKGGTFILVYHTKPVPVQAPAGTGSAQQNNQNQAARFAAEVADVSMAVPGTGTAPLTVTAVNYDIVRAVNELISLKDAGATPVKLEDKVREILWVKDTTPVVVKPEVRNIFDSVIEGTVIADFYVPYNCCDDSCPSIHFVPGEELPEQATVAIDETVFCGGDEDRYEITTSPGGGTLTGDGIVEDNGVFYFVPSTVTIEDDVSFVEPVITYTTDESTAFVKLKVFAAPHVALQQPVVNGADISLSKTITGAGDVRWSFGDGIESTDPNLTSYTYSHPGTYTITLTASNSACDPVSDSKTVVIENVTLDINTTLREFCQGDAAGNTTYNVTVTPADSVLTIDNVTQVSDGTGIYHFLPKGISVPAGTSKTVRIKATKGTLNQFMDVKINAVPNATFAAPTITGTQATFAYTPQSGNVVSWNFGDSSSPSSLANPIHTFPGPGTYPVTLTVTNNGCPQTFTRNVVIENATISITDKDICLADNSSTRVLTVSPAGGFVSGEGAVNGTPPVFDPARVTFAQGQTKKTITLTYTVNGLTATTTVNVYKAVDATFSYSEIGNNTISFSYTVPAGARLRWAFGDGQVLDTTEFQITHQYTEVRTYDVTLTVINDPCQPVIKTLPVVVKGDPARIDITKTQFCKTDNGSYEIIVSPAGGVLSINGVTQTASPHYYFTPSATSIATGSAGATVHLNYRVNATQADKDLQVDAMWAEFDTSVSGDTATMTITAAGIKGTWDFGDGQTQPVTAQRTVTHKYAAIGTYTVTLTNTDSQGSCTQVSGTRTVQISQVGTPVIQIDNPGREFCADVSDIILIQVSPDGGVFKRNGTVVNGTVATLQPSAQGVTPGGTAKSFTYTYTYNGITASDTITVNPLPANPDFLIEGGSNGSYTFTNNTPGTTVVSWNFGDNSTGTGGSATHTYATAGTYTVTMTVTNGKCSVAKQKSVTAVKDTPKLTISDPGRTFCADDGSLITVQASPAGGSFKLNGASQGTLNYAFRPDQFAINPGQQPLQLTFSYLLNGTTATETITVQPLPVASFEAVLVSGFTYRFTNTSEAGTTVESWDFADGSSGFGGQDMLDHTFPGPGDYDVSIFVSGSMCSNGYAATVSVADTGTVECNKPCGGISETSQYSWPSRKHFVLDRVFDAGHDYAFFVNEYTVDGKELMPRGASIPFTITKESYDAQGFQAIFDALMKAFPEGVGMRYDPENLLFNGDFINFDVTRYACQSFRFTIIDSYEAGGSNKYDYTYTEKGMAINGGEFPYEQKLNPVIADECIDIRPEPCASMDKCIYLWPHDARMYEDLMNNGGFMGYDIVVHGYRVANTVIADSDLHYVIPFNEFESGLQDAVDLLNSHFIFREALRFDSVNGQNGDVVYISRYACQDFEFNFTVSFTRDGVVMPETSVTFMYTQDGSYKDESGIFQFIQPPQECQPTTYIPPLPAVCTLPCNGLTETATFNWPDTEGDILSQINENGMYTFLVGKYRVNGVSVNAGQIPVSVMRSQDDLPVMSIIASALNDTFKEGVDFDNYTELTLPPLVAGMKFGPAFTIKYPACQGYVVEITSTLSGDLYSYSQNGVIVNGKGTQYPQRLNAAMADECISMRPEPCDGKTNTLQYEWLQSEEEIKNMAREGQSYTFTITGYVVNSQSVIKASMQHILPPEAYQNGWTDIAAYLNRHLKLSDGVVFDTDDVLGRIMFTFPACTTFNLDISGYGKSLMLNEGNGK